MSGYGQEEPPGSYLLEPQVEGPFDYSCNEEIRPHNMDPETCVHLQDEVNQRVRLDEPYMWTHRILPGAAVGLVVGIGISYLVWGRD